MFGKIFKNKEGKVVIAQIPNWPMYGWLAARVAMRIANSSQIKDVFNYVSAGFIFVWAMMEIFSGVNYFRRLLGLVILTLTMYGLIK